FLEEDLLIPYIESVLRVFDRYGERNSRHKARIKFLIQKIGIDSFNELVAEEQLALTHQRYKIDAGHTHSTTVETAGLNGHRIHSGDANQNSINTFQFERWKKTNVFKQKQDGYYAVYLRIANGNISSATSRRL